MNVMKLLESFKKEAVHAVNQNFKSLISHSKPAALPDFSVVMTGRLIDGDELHK